jgi:DNA polymerase-1
MRIINTAELTPKTKLSPDDRHWCYNGLDCCVTLEVLQAIRPQLDNTTGSTYAFSKALQGPVLEMSSRGVRIHHERRNRVMKEFGEKSAKVDAQLTRMFDAVGAPVKWSSPAQLKEFFYDVLGLTAIRKRNVNGVMAPTVNRDALERLSGYFIAEPFCTRILLLRDLAKKRQFLETELDPDGRIRSSFNIAGTNTGRLSSSMSEFGTGGNLQNVDRDLRSVFIADPGMKFVNVDLEQGDARNVGAICWNNFIALGERFAGSYLDACESGDLHTTVAKMVWPQLQDKADAEKLFYRQDSYRQIAKKLGHGSNYLGQPKTMARHTKVSQPIIEDFQLAYFKAFGCIPLWHEAVAEQLPCLTTMLGRRRMFFGRILPKDSKGDNPTLREAVAFEPQSLTAEEIDLGMLAVWRAGLAQIMIQVHDSLLLQVREEQADELIPRILQTMRVTIPLAKGREFTVPLDAKVGWNWGDHSATNPDGMIKYKGSDNRGRQEWPSKLTIR